MGKIRGGEGMGMQEGIGARCPRVVETPLLIHGLSVMSWNLSF
jgi:hypothetical protein